MTALIARLGEDGKPIVVAAGFILVILAAGTAYTLTTQGTATLLSPTYLMQQLHIGSFLGLVAAGMMLVILIGHIDLSVAWTLTAAAITATAVGGPYAIPAGLAVGLGVGILNGLGVAYLRIPSMIFTLGVNAVLRGLVVAQTGGFAPQTSATDAMRFLGAERVAGLPMALVVWSVGSVFVMVLLSRTAFGLSLYAVGNHQGAAYLSGIATRRVTCLAFVLCSLLASVAGILLAGYSAKAYQGMGDAYVLPAIAAVVIGGTHILGGKGLYAGTVVGVMLIVLLNSVLSIMQMPEAGRQIIYGVVIIAMLLVYGRGRRASG